MFKLFHKDQVDEKRVSHIMEATGWSRKDTIAKVKACKKLCGINYADYDRYKFYAVPGEEQAEKYHKILDKREREQKEKEKRIAHIMEATGWSKKETIAKVKACKRLCGITYTDYDRYNFHQLTEAEQAKKYAAIHEKKEEKRRLGIEQKEHCIVKTMELTGWSRKQAQAHIADARRRTGCKFKEYILYRFYDLTEQEQEQMCLITLTAKLSKKYNVNSNFAKMLINKEQTDQYFEEFVARPWCVNTKTNYATFEEKFANSDKIIYKPIDGIGGHGIKTFNLTENNRETIWQELTQCPEGVVEEYVVQHPEMSALSPSSVNTLRIVTISSKTKPVTSDGRFMDVAYAALRIGGGGSVVDNFHSGGMVAAVDLATGTVVTDAVDMEGHVFSSHPVTGKVFKGFQIPLFDKAMEMVRQACEKDLVEGNLGWDIAITANGAVLIEANVGPGVVLLQTPYVPERKGMKHVMAKYL